VVCVLAVALLAGCGKNEQKERGEREQLVREKLKREYKAGVLTETVMDSLRAMKERFGITRDEYWDKDGGVLANDFLELWYPPGPVTVTHGMYAFQQLVAARARFQRLFGRDPADHLTVVCGPSMPEFTDDTGLEWYVYSRVTNDEIYYQPIDVLFVRKLGEVAVRRGYYVWGIHRLSKGQSPHWFEEGMASLLADEDKFLEMQLKEFPDSPVKMSIGDIETALRKKDDRKMYRIALYDSWRMVRRLVAAHGNDKIAEVVLHMERGEKRDKAFETVFGQPYDRVVGYALDFKVNE
jgi:hypothetical protein